MATPPKRKVSITLDEDLVAEVEAGGEGLSGRVNDALRADLTSRRRQRALTELLDRLAGDQDRLDTPADRAEIARFMRLLGGEPDPDLATAAAQPGWAAV